MTAKVETKMSEEHISGAQQPLYLEDMYVGRKFTTGTHAVDAAQIKAFANTFDPQPFHTDEEAAKHSIFGGLVASGWHTSGISMRLLIGGLPLANGVIGLGGEVTWPKPTRPGDVLHLEGEVVEVTPSRSHPDRGTIVVAAQTFNQKGEAVQIFKARLMVSRRPVKG